MKNIYTTVILALSVYSLTAIAQTGPGGVGNSSNNVIWLDGNIVTVAVHPKISTWPDQSGNGNNFNQATPSLQPTVVGYGFVKGLRFSSGLNRISSVGIPALNTNLHTQFIVYHGGTPNHTGMLFEGSFTQSNQFYRTFRTSLGTVRSWVLNSSGGIVDNIGVNTSSFQLVNSIWDGINQTFSTYKDGTLLGVKTGANGNPSGNYANTIGASYNGDMGEIIVFNSVLNSAKRNIVSNYLASKFNLTIANDLYSHDATTLHRNELIGIGQEVDGNNLIAKGKGIVQLTATSLNNGEYILSGHNNIPLSNVSSDVPASIPGGSRMDRTWRVGVTGAPNPITVSFDVASLPLPLGSYYLLVESNNGIFNDGGVVSYGPFSDVGGVVTFSGVSFTDGNYYTIAAGSSAVIQSIKTDFWDVASTWNCNCVPSLSDNVLINAGHTITIRTSVSVNDITINGTLNSQQVSNFNIKGDYTLGNTGSVLHKTVLFSGTVTQNLTNNHSVNVVTIPTLIINNPTNVVVQAGKFDVSNSLQIPSGTFQNLGGKVRFLSTATNTAVALNIVGNFSGNFFVQRYVSSRNANWADLSSPVTGATLGDWDSDQTGTVAELFMSGVGGVSGNAGSFVSVVRWDAPTQAYIDITDTNYVLVPGNATEVFLADNLSTFNAKTFDSYGTPNFGNILVSVSNSFNLVGNPYQAWINWTSLTKPTLQSTYYIFNTNTGTFDAKTSGSIPPHQGFWVESVGSGTLTFTESAKNGSGSSTFFRANQDEMSFPAIDDEAFMNQGEEPFEFTEVQLKVKSDINRYNHTLKLRMNNLATINYDYHDGSFLPSRVLEAPSITTYSANNNKKLALNSFSFQDEITMPIAIEVGVSGNYIIEAINFENFAQEYKVMELKDYKSGKIYDLTSTKEINVAIDEFDKEERFSLTLSNNKRTSISLAATSNIRIYQSNENTIIELEDAETDYTLSVYNALGQKTMDDIIISNTNRYVLNNASFSKGLAIVKITSINGEIIKKLTY